MSGAEPRPFVDTHVHFWDPDRLRYRWLDDEPALSRPFLPGQLAQDAPHPSSIVVVQADCAPDQATAEVAWLEELARAGAPIAGIVAHAPLEAGSACRAVLARLAGSDRVVGVRRLLQDERPGFALEAGFVAGVQLLAGLGLTFDLCVRHHQLDEVTELARRCPEVTFVLDHLGKPEMTNAGFRPWADALERLAAQPRVHCKLSGLATEAAPGAVTRAAPYLRQALDTFGAERCVFGSDWPVLTTATTYAAWHRLVEESLAGLPSPARDRVMHDNATALYGLQTKGAAHADR